MFGSNGVGCVKIRALVGEEKQAVKWRSGSVRTLSSTQSGMTRNAHSSHMGIMGICSVARCFLTDEDSRVLFEATAKRTATYAARERRRCRMHSATTAMRKRSGRFVCARSRTTVRQSSRCSASEVRASPMAVSPS